MSSVWRIHPASLRHALATAEHLNFRHAAIALGTTQSCVSARIKALEDELGILLFERRHRGVRLTDAGRRFIEEISLGMSHIEHAIATAGRMADGQAGNVWMGVPYPVVDGFLAELSRRFRAYWPDVELSIAEGKAENMTRQIREGALDIAFVVGGVESTDCHAKPLWSEPLIVAVAKDHPLAERDLIWNDLVPETFLDPIGGSGLRLSDHVIRRVAERGHRPRIRRCEAGRDTLMYMVAAREGIKLTTLPAMHIPFPGVVFRSIADEPEHAQFSAVWSPHNRNPALKNLLDLAAEMRRSANSP